MPNENDDKTPKAGGKTPAAKAPKKKPAKKKGSSKRKPRGGAKAAAAKGAADQGGLGNAGTPANTPIPEKMLIPRGPEAGAGEQPPPLSQSPAVQGDQTQMIMDILQKRPVEVFLIEAKALVKGAKGRLVFVQGPVSNGLMTVAAARTKFAVLKDGTAVYNAHGFDDVPSTAKDFDLLDVEALIEHNNA